MTVDDGTGLGTFELVEGGEGIDVTVRDQCARVASPRQTDTAAVSVGWHHIEQLFTHMHSITSVVLTHLHRGGVCMRFTYPCANVYTG